MDRKDRIRTGALVLAAAGCLAASTLAFRLGRSLDASEQSLARAEDRIRTLERAAEEAEKERIRLADELRGLKDERSRHGAAAVVRPAARPEDDIAEALARVLDDVPDETSVGNLDGAIPNRDAASEPAPPDPEPARQQRAELFGPHAPAVEDMLTLHADERFAELAALADVEIARDPDFTFAWVQGGLAYLRLGQVERARGRLLVARDRAQGADARLAPYYRAAWFALEDLEP
jgi:hypothetical protein